MRYDPSLEQGTLDREKGTIDLHFYCATVPTSSGMDVLKTILDNLTKIEKQMDEAGAQKQAWTHTWKGAEFRFVFSLLDEEDTPIANRAVTLQNGLLNGDILRPMTAMSWVTFRGVDVYKITDTLRIRIDRINGVPVAEGSSSLIKISTARFSNSSYNINGFNRLGWDRGGYGLDGYNKSGYNRQGRDRKGLTWGQKAAAAVHARLENNAKRGLGVMINFIGFPPFKIDSLPEEADGGMGFGLEALVGLGNFGLWFGFAGLFSFGDAVASSENFHFTSGPGGGLLYAGGSLHLFKHISLDMGLGWWGMNYNYRYVWEETSVYYDNSKKDITGTQSNTYDTKDMEGGFDLFVIIPGVTLYLGTDSNGSLIFSGRMLYDPINNIPVIMIGFFGGFFE
jgi:hypothetical protein